MVFAWKLEVGRRECERRGWRSSAPGSADWSALPCSPRRGYAVTRVESADGPGGKMREVAVERREIDAGPTVLTMRWVFEEIFAEAGASLADHVTLQPLRTLARHAWSDGRGSICSPTSSEAPRRSAISPARAKPRAFAPFCRRARAIYETWRVRSCAARGRTRFRLTARVGLSRLPRTLAHLAVRHAVERARRTFPRSAPAAIVRPLRHLLRLLAVSGAGDADAGRPCRAGGRLARRGRHARLGARAGRSRQPARRDAPLWPRRRAHPRRKRDAPAASIAEDGERFAADAVVFNGDAAALGAGALGDRAARAVNDGATSARLAVRADLRLVGRAEGFPLAHHNVFFSDDYRAEFDEILVARRLPREPTIYVCAQDRANGGRVVDTARAAVLSRQRAADRRQRRAIRIGVGHMRTGDVSTSGLLGLTIRRERPERCGPVPTNSRGCFRRQRGRSTGRRRTAGGPRSRERGPDAPAGALSRGRQRASGPGRADGGAVGSTGGDGLAKD